MQTVNPSKATRNEGVRAAIRRSVRPHERHTRKGGEDLPRSDVPHAMSRRASTRRGDFPLVQCGEGTGTRTLDTLIKSQLLYRLSYTPDDFF